MSYLAAMEYLSPTALHRAAPASAPRRDADKGRLIDTTAFLNHLAHRYRARPVYALQGSGHSDAETARTRNGRHLVVAASTAGLAFSLLNSHTKDRRAQIGFGLTDGDAFLLGPAVFVKRWLGAEEPISEMVLRYDQTMFALQGRLLDWHPTRAALQTMAATIAKTGYLNRDAYPTADALLADVDLHGSALSSAFAIFKRMRDGRLDARRGERRVKGIGRPDALVYASLVVLKVFVDTGKHARRIPASFDFGTLNERRPRA